MTSNFLLKKETIMRIQEGINSCGIKGEYNQYASAIYVTVLESGYIPKADIQLKSEKKYREIPIFYGSMGKNEFRSAFEELQNAGIILPFPIKRKKSQLPLHLLVLDFWRAEKERDELSYDDSPFSEFMGGPLEATAAKNYWFRQGGHGSVSILSNIFAMYGLFASNLYMIDKFDEDARKVEIACQADEPSLEWIGKILSPITSKGYMNVRTADPNYAKKCLPSKSPLKISIQKIGENLPHILQGWYIEVQRAEEPTDVRLAGFSNLMQRDTWEREKASLTIHWGIQDVGETEGKNERKPLSQVLRNFFF